ncbi:hypothetical protein NFHSH190041_12160 [Shewanella sp. NFH-SH190041]|uniref:hypothetical protein n=1 Tax=Shewanella sp. NFH-SH190041 TaxID=2950245 RepID=UPI0021C489DB|nr:hypothetical protein [Shewanella sp. NFH-SH190041]BDM63764.1 hypothetical protein NFHSH190041_12160 [Shewanella sp. NFH-SH190041]
MTETGHENPESDSGLSGKSGNLLTEMQDNTTNLIQHDSKNIPEAPLNNPEMNQQALREVPPQFPNQSGEIPEAKTNRYGDEQLTRLKGIVRLGIEIVTRVHEWTLSVQSMSHAPSSNRLSLEYCQ